MSNFPGGKWCTVRYRGGAGRRSLDESRNKNVAAENSDGCGRVSDGDVHSCRWV